MKVDKKTLPSEDEPSLLLVRLKPQNKEDRDLLNRMETCLRATNAVVARPEIDGEKILSLMFTGHNKKKKSANHKEKD